MKSIFTDVAEQQYILLMNYQSPFKILIEGKGIVILKTVAEGQYTMMENAENAINKNFRHSYQKTNKQTKNNQEDIRFTAEKKANLKHGCNITPIKTLSRTH